MPERRPQPPKEESHPKEERSCQAEGQEGHPQEGSQVSSVPATASKHGPRGQDVPDEVQFKWLFLKPPPIKKESSARNSLLPPYKYNAVFQGILLLYIILCNPCAQIVSQSRAHSQTRGIVLKHGICDCDWNFSNFRKNR